MSQRKDSKRVMLCGQTPGPAAPTAERAGAPAKPYIYLLSPADSTGRRAAMLFNPRAKFELAERLRTTGISLGEAFSFMSSLYFRGKLAYAGTFSKTVSGISGTLVITPCRGLLRPETQVRLSELADIVGERIVHHNPKYRDPLERDLRSLSEAIGQQFRVVLLGSIATKKYVPLLLEILGERLLVPRAFIGLGNLSRGGLLLRSSRERSELTMYPRNGRSRRAPDRAPSLYQKRIRFVRISTKSSCIHCLIALPFEQEAPRHCCSASNRH